MPSSLKRQAGLTIGASGWCVASDDIVQGFAIDEFDDERKLPRSFYEREKMHDIRVVETLQGGGFPHEQLSNEVACGHEGVEDFYSDGVRWGIGLWAMGVVVHPPLINDTHSAIPDEVSYDDLAPTEV